MGNADLRSIAALEDIPFEDLGGSVVAIDAHNWLYRYLTTTVRFTNSQAYTTSDGTEVANLIGLVRGVPKLLEHDLTPVFVFDGAVVGLKDDEVEQRREERKRREEQLETAREVGDAKEIARLDSQTQRLTDVIQETTRELLSHLGIPTVEAPGEGEAQAAHMARRGDVDYVGTEDYDALLLGAPLTLRQLTSQGDPELMDFEATLARHDVTWEQLVDAAILMGTDFNEGISGYGPKTAITAVKEHGDLWDVFEAEDVYVEYADQIRELFLNPRVTDEYEFETAVEPNLDAARAYVREWEIPDDAVERGFERIEEATVQTGLDRWS